MRATQNYEQVREDVREDALALIGLGLGALVLGLGVAWFLAGGLARPLATLAETARRVGPRRSGGAGKAHWLDRAPGGGARVQRDGGAPRPRAGGAARVRGQRLAPAATPLTGLKLRLEAAGYKTDDPDVRRDIEAAERETERLDRLLSDLLTLAADTEQAGEGELVELGDVARAARERWQDTAAATGHDLALNGNGAVCVRSSPSDLAAILDNLVENAINYSPDGSDVELTWGGARLSRPTSPSATAAPASLPPRPTGSSTASIAARTPPASPAPAWASRSWTPSPVAGVARTAIENEEPPGRASKSRCRGRTA